MNNEKEKEIIMDDNDLMFEEQEQPMQEEAQEPIVIYQEEMNITKEDLYEYHYFLASRRKPLGSFMLGIFAIVLGIVGFIQDTGLPAHLSNGLLCLLGIFFILYALVFSKMRLKKRINNLQLQDMEPVEAIISEEGIIYKFANEETEEPVVPFGWNLVFVVVEHGDHIYVQMVDRRTVFLIKKSQIRDENFYFFLKDKAVSLKKWQVIKK